MSASVAGSRGGPCNGPLLCMERTRPRARAAGAPRQGRAAQRTRTAAQRGVAVHTFGTGLFRSVCIARPWTRGSLLRAAAGRVTDASASSVDKGFSLLEWTNKLVPQGSLVSGAKLGWRLAWQTMVRELAPQTKSGAYSRPSYSFTGRVGDAQFPAASGRYVFYLGNACPWCHRVSLALVLRGLVPHVRLVQLRDEPERATRGGWVLDAPDPVFGVRDLWGVYDAASPGFRGRCTAPLLVDGAARVCVSNESADIVRNLNDVQLPGCTAVDLYPPTLRPQIDQLNDTIYACVNNGVYRAGFSTTQAAYDEVVGQLYGALDQLDARLAASRFLLGDKFTEADLRLFPTLVRFDAVYAGIFKCSRKRVADYPYLSAWLRDVYQITVPGASLQVRDTVDVDACRKSYYTNLFPLNPGGVVPSGPTAKDLGLDVPVQRGATGFEDCFHLRA